QAAACGLAGAGARPPPPRAPPPRTPQTRSRPGTPLWPYRSGPRSGSCAAPTAPPALGSRLFDFSLEALDFFFEGDHLELTPYHHFLKLLQVENLFLQFRLRLLQVAHHLLIRAHVAQDTDGADHLALRVAQGRGVQGGGDHLARGAARIQAHV